SVPFLQPPRSSRCPYTTLFRSTAGELAPVQQKLFTGAAGTPMVFRLSDVQFDDASFEGDVLHAPPGNGQALVEALAGDAPAMARSEEHTSELQSRENLVCRLLL